jgi:hypothetical protein
MLQLFYLDIAYVSHKCCKRMSQIFHLFKMYVAFECFMLQVQTADVGVHGSGQGQATATDVWRRHKPPPTVWGGGGGESSGRPGRDGRRTGVEEAGASHPSSVSSGYEAGCSDVSVGNEAGADSTRIRADGVEHLRAFERPGTSAAV